MENRFAELIKAAGVIGAGGAGFPTHIKLSSKPEYLIMNAAECEPLIRVDQQLLLYYTGEILQGFQQILEETGAKKAFIALKSKHTKVIDRLKAELVNYRNIEIFEMKDFYPAGDEQVTVYEVLKRVVPQGGIPLEVGCVVCNVETVLNAYYALRGEPVTATYVTVTGEVQRPATYKIPIGVSYREALKLSGTEDLSNKTALDGGPMMGKLVTDFDLPITKTTKAIILLDNEHYVIRKKGLSKKQILNQSKVACIQCVRCTDLCPRNLLGHNVKPHLVMRIANFGLKDFEGMKTALGCSECGACELFACPNSLSPKSVNVMVKQELARTGVKFDSKGKTFTPSPYFEYRRIPVKRLIQRLDLKKYDVEAPLSQGEYKPDVVVIPLKQHVGAPASALVTKGTAVEKGALIAGIEDGKLGANIHASISGTVTDVSDQSIVIRSN